MKNLKKFLVLGLVGLMVFSFAACSSSDNDDKDKDNKNEQTEEQADDKDDKDDKDDADKDDKDEDVSADELLENIPIDDIESLSAYLELVADVDMDLKQALIDSGTTEEEIEEALDNGDVTEEELNASISLDIELTLDMSKDYSHISGSMDLSGMGEEESETIDSYIDTTADDETITYTYDEYLESWYYEVEEVEDGESDNEAIEFISSIKDYVNSAEITDEDDDKYTLEVVLDIAGIYEDESEMVDDLVGSSADSIGDTEDIFGAFDELTVTVEIDKEEGYLLAVKIDFVDAVEDLLESLAESDAEAVAYTDYITINELAINIELSDYNDVEVEIPEDVIDEATELYSDEFEDQFGDDDEDVDTEDDEDTEVVYGGTYDIYNYDDELVSTVTIPDEFYADMEYSDENTLYLENENWDQIEVSTYPSYWVSYLVDGDEYEPDLDFYTRDEIEERASIETEQGTVRVFVHIWSMDEDYENDYYESIVYGLVKDGELVLYIDSYIDEIEDNGYTVESLIQTMLQ